MFKSFATILTRVVTDDVGSDITSSIQSGRPIKVFGFKVHTLPTSAPIITFADANGNTLFTFYIIANSSSNHGFICKIPFIADKGLQVTITSTTNVRVEVIVYHTHEGT